jgi:hypothetical protein
VSWPCNYLNLEIICSTKVALTHPQDDWWSTVGVGLVISCLHWLRHLSADISFASTLPVWQVQKSHLEWFLCLPFLKTLKLLEPIYKDRNIYLPVLCIF